MLLLLVPAIDTRLEYSGGMVSRQSARQRSAAACAGMTWQIVVRVAGLRGMDPRVRRETVERSMPAAFANAAPRPPKWAVMVSCNVVVV